MSNAIPADPHLFALLIGVDYYAPNQMTLDTGTGYWPSLHGCVADIAYIERVLQQAWGLTPDHTVKLTVSGPPGSTPEPPEQWPTYAHIVAAFRRVTDLVQAGDQVYIHYSGHGGRTPTMVPALKGSAGIDEVLVPTDIGPPPEGGGPGRYLHDIEIAKLLRTMADKGLKVTAVFDSCHSGGAARGEADAVPRGSAQIDRTPRLVPSAVATLAELGATWQAPAGATEPHFGSGWLPVPGDYVFLAACAATEQAMETQFPDGWHGALTYWLADTLQQRHADFTYRQLYNRLLGKVHSQFASQTPQLEGDADRFVLGSVGAPPAFAVNVMAVAADQAPPRVRLLTGQAQGLRSGAQFAIYPPGTRDFTQRDQRIATATISELGATESWATLAPADPARPLDAAQVAVGARAVLIDLGASRLRRAVRLVDDGNPAARAALDGVQQALEAGGTGWLRLAQTGEPVRYHVGVTGDGMYEIRDAGGQPIPNIRPALPTGEAESAARLVRRLVHLATYDNIRQLDNRDRTSPLAGKLLVELCELPPDYDREDPDWGDYLQPIPGSGSLLARTAGERFYLRMTNRAAQALNFAVLDLGADWSVTQLYPGPGEEAGLLEPGPGFPLELVATLPGADYSAGTEVLKVIATAGPCSFRWMELPPLDEALVPTAAKGALPSNPLEDLLAALTDPSAAPASRADVVPIITYEWVTAQVELQTHRP